MTGRPRRHPSTRSTSRSPASSRPRLALAFACERGGLPEVAEGLYQVCASTDAAYVPPAAFGMARVRAERQDTAGAVAALDLVPNTSRGYTESRQQRAEVLLSGGVQDLAVLDQAMRTIESSSVDGPTRQRYTVRILNEALPVVTSGTKAARRCADRLGGRHRGRRPRRAGERPACARPRHE
ncbi:tetratricopeptide repeat protein [Nocardioides convexus]|uniref:tetratricopeptide repeat protein n=1 Tax=Nocardioides convexus TaxID=2712224 RepID=UPI0024181A0F|nr:tetratricopeptide repeat protein [Nocardioides convexus]